MQGKATTKANPVDFFWIQAPEDFTPCMKAVGGLGYSCVNTSTVDADGQIVWGLTMNSPTQTGVVANIGEVVAWDEMQLVIYPNSDAFLALHDVTQ